MSNEPPLFDNTLSSRYECKYLLDERTAQAIRSYIRPYAEFDPFSMRSEDGRYRVLSVYLDNPSFRLYRDTMGGVRNRYKIRLRYYAEQVDGPVYLEVKKRSNIVVRKSRELVRGRDANQLLLRGDFKATDSHGEFSNRCRESGAQPALRVRYWREAWESRAMDPVRLTFDTNVEHCILSDPGLVETRPDWRATSVPAEVILEVKFTSLMPSWLRLMLRHFQLDKVSVAKYAESVSDVFTSGRKGVLEAAMGIARPWPRVAEVDRGHRI
jgi:hypothetical protein